MPTPDEILAQLNLPLTHKLTLDDLVRRIGDATQRTILLIPWSLPREIFGAWISDARRPTEYIFYQKDLTPLHRVHVVLHEVSHFLLGHKTVRVEARDVLGTLQGGEDTVSPAVTCAIQLRAGATISLLDDQEAEKLAAAIGEKLSRRTVTSSLSSDESVSAVLRKLG